MTIMIKTNLLKEEEKEQEEDSKNPLMDFLAREGILDTFINNLQGRAGKIPTKDLKEFKDKRNAIDRALIWSATQEGHEFWENIDSKWRDYLRYEV